MPTAPAASLLARDISLSRGTVVILDDVSVTVSPSTRLGVIGPNGVGKTTLLRVLAGLETPDSGTVAKMPPSLNVGYLAQEPAMRPGENLSAYLSRRTGVADAEAARAASADQLGHDAPGAGDTYSEALDRYLALGGPDLEARAASVCVDLGLSTDLLDAPTTTLSGGQAARASLAGLLLSRFDVLLLDEPTNDLDFAGLDRLEQFMDRPPGGVVVVSHDRAFLERSISSVLEIDEATHRAQEYRGGWKAYLEAREVARRHAGADYESYVAQRDDLTGRESRQRQWATSGVARDKRRPRDGDKAQRGFRVNRTEKQASKVQSTERALERLAVVDKPWEGWQLNMEIASAARSGDVVLRLDQARIERGSWSLGPLDLEIMWQDRLGVLGPNGSGKTSLLGAILGRVPLAGGTRWMGPGVVVGELGQQRRRFSGGRLLIDAFLDESGMALAEGRSLLAKFGLGAHHCTREADSLSPGERTRAELALLMARGVNALVLDEPTNHLDMAAIEQLEEALESWDGTLILVTHDRRLSEAVRLTRRLELA
ncbi:MAG: ABC-F family ATP-binding cassette domain-containing protein [Acidimicrobiales bacterium]